jgi:hypothetical protein
MGYELCGGVTMEEVDGESIFTTKQGDAAVLNETAAYIVKLLLDGAGHDAAMEKAAEIYEADRETIRRDIWELMRELTQKELICPCCRQADERMAAATIGEA